MMFTVDYREPLAILFLSRAFTAISRKHNIKMLFKTEFRVAAAYRFASKEVILS